MYVSRLISQSSLHSNQQISTSYVKCTTPLFNQSCYRQKLFSRFFWHFHPCLNDLMNLMFFNKYDFPHYLAICKHVANTENKKKFTYLGMNISSFDSLSINKFMSNFGDETQNIFYFFEFFRFFPKMQILL